MKKNKNIKNNGTNALLSFRSFLRVSEDEFREILEDFVQGLLKRANVKHAGNCYTMSQILKPYVGGLFAINTLIVNAKVKQGRRKVNHYYLMNVKDGSIIDGTASQFKTPEGKQMPQVYIGKKPDWYLDGYCT